MYDIKDTSRNNKEETFPELIGGLIVSLVMIAFYLAVPVIIFAACVKILFF